MEMHEMGKSLDEVAVIGLYKGFDNENYRGLLWAKFGKLDHRVWRKAVEIMLETRQKGFAPNIPEWRHYVAAAKDELRNVYQPPQAQGPPSIEQPLAIANDACVRTWKRMIENSDIDWEADPETVLMQIMTHKRAGTLRFRKSAGFGAALERVEIVPEPEPVPVPEPTPPEPIEEEPVDMSNVKQMGPCEPEECCISDLDLNRVVDVADLAALIVKWG